MIKVEYIPGKHFTLDFARVILRPDGTFEYMISRTLSLSFTNLLMLHEDTQVYVTLKEIISSLKLFEDSDRAIDRKLKLFGPHEEDRIKRYFDGEGKQIFFDSDQVFKLEEAFDRYVFLADAEILFEGQLAELNKLKSTHQRAVIDAMLAIGLVYDLDPEMYRGFANLKKVKVIAKRTNYQEGGVKIMSKSKLIWKGIGGSILVAIGSGVLITGVTVVTKAASTLLGIEKEIILIENDEE